jgi:hypothetical protein
MSEMNDAKHKPEWNYLGRNLENYKALHAKTAEDKGVGAALKAAKTLTQARKIVFGYKRGNSK